MARSLRDRINQNRNAALGVAGAAAVVALLIVVIQVLGNRRTFASKLPEAFFTVDDGKTYFTANSENVPPFDYKGQQAVRAYVFEAGGQRFVGYLERYTPEAHKAMVENKATPQHQMYGRELKKPGDAKWEKSGDFAAMARVTEVKSPSGQANPEPVEP